MMAPRTKNQNYGKSRWKEICELGEKENFKVIITLQPMVGAGNKVLADWELRHVEEAAGHAASYKFYER